MEKRTLLPNDIYQIKTVGEADVSSDGRYVAYVVERVVEEKDRGLTDIYLHDLTTQQTKRLTNSGRDGSPRFSPDGRRLAFISSRTEKAQIWVLELDGGEAWHLVTEEAVAGAPYWFSDGRQMAYTANVFVKPADWTPYPGAPSYDAERLAALAKRPTVDKQESDKKPNEVKVVTRLRYRGDGVGFYGETKRHVFITPVPESTPFAELVSSGERVTLGDYDFGTPTISPDGHYLVSSARTTEQADYEPRSDLWLWEVETGKSWLLYQGPGPVSQPLWSPQGDLIAFVGHDNAQNVSTTTDLWLLPIGSFLEQLPLEQPPTPFTVGSARNVTKPLDRPVGAHAGPELRHGGSSSFWADDRLYFILSDRGAGGVYAVDATCTVQPVLVDQHSSITSIAGNGQVLVYTASRPNRPEELYLCTEQGSQSLTLINEEFLAGVSLGDWERITYPSTDGQAIDGWVIYPVDYQPDKRYPLMLLIHGGPHGAYGPAFMFAGQIFAGQGYVVLFTNPRGSTTYGQDFARAIDKNWGAIDYADIMAGVDTVIDSGLADPDQLFVHGWSFGGYMTCWMVTQTNRFRAACGGASVTNMISDYGTSDIMWADEWEYGGQPWRDHDHLMQHSPLAHVEQVTTPLLLLHGESDMRVPISQSEEFYVALKRLGKTAVMVRYPGEFHGLKRPVHRVDRYERLLAWFEHYRQD